MDECKPLGGGICTAGASANVAHGVGDGRGLHSSTFQLNLSRF